MLRRDDLVAASRSLLREGGLTKLRRSRWTNETRPHASRRAAFCFSDIFVLHAADSESARILPLGTLVVVTADLVRCSTLGNSRTLPYEANPTDQRRSALQPAIAALGLEPSALNADDLQSTTQQ